MLVDLFKEALESEMIGVAVLKTEIHGEIKVKMDEFGCFKIEGMRGYFAFSSDVILDIDGNVPYVWDRLVG